MKVIKATRQFSRLSAYARERRKLTEKYKEKIIDGTKISEEIRKHIKSTIIEHNEILEPKFHDRPRLGYIMVGDRPESELYVKLKTEACDSIGIEHEGIRLPADVSEQHLINCTINMTKSTSVSGVII